MKKICFLMCIFLCLCFLTSCGLVSYTSEKSNVEETDGLNQLKKEYFYKLDNLFNEDLYYEKEQTMLLEILIEGKSEINDADNEDQMKSIFSKYENFIKNLKTKSQYLTENFEEYKKRNIDDITKYLILEDYRKNEVNQIKNILSEYIEKINNATTENDVDNYVRGYKIEVYFIKTDQDLYQEELEQMKTEAIEEISHYKDMTTYRDNEVLILKEIIVSFKNQLAVLSTKELVTALVDNYKIIIDSIKNSNQLYEEERLELINQYYIELLNLIDTSKMDNQYINEYQNKCLMIKNEMLELKTKEQINSKFLSEKRNLFVLGAQNGDENALKSIIEIYIEDLYNYLDETLYREEQINEIHLIIKLQGNEIRNCENYDSVLNKVEQIHNALNEVLTNDEMWIKEDREFLTSLSQKYENKILTPPDSLTEADSYDELANIVDYYAFYQIDKDLFERNKFRIKINFEYEDSTQIKNTIYWLCQLIRGAVGLKTYFEYEDYLIVQLIPYDMATVKNQSDIHAENRYNNSLEFKSLAKESREPSFDNFAYKSNSKKAKIWNTQQLWYALEHDYLPECVPDSSAEMVLNNAKDILREIIKNDMTKCEKIFAIFKWFGDNVVYDYQANVFSNNMDEYPDEIPATQRGFFAEGALIDKQALCSGYAKAYLILLKLEGIEAKHILAKANEFIGKNSINSVKDGNGFYGSHEFVYIKLDGKWYYSDPEKSFDNNHNYIKSFIYCLLPVSMIEYYTSDMVIDNVEESTPYLDFYNQLTYCDVAIFNCSELSSILNQESFKNNSVSIFCDDKEYNTILEIIENSGLDFVEIKKYNGTKLFVEFVVYKLDE